MYTLLELWRSAETVCRQMSYFYTQKKNIKSILLFHRENVFYLRPEPVFLHLCKLQRQNLLIFLYILNIQELLNDTCIFVMHENEFINLSELFEIVLNSFYLVEKILIIARNNLLKR